MNYIIIIIIAPITQIKMVCHLPPFAKVGQTSLGYTHGH